MTLEFNRFVWKPSVVCFGYSVINAPALDLAVEMMGATDAAEQEGTPLNGLVQRAIAHEGLGDDIAEFAGRQCYRSWWKGRDSETYHRNIRGMGHGSIYEHASMNFQISGVSRSFSHEIVRHRTGTGFSQESQRYVDAKDMRFVVPVLLANEITRQLGVIPNSQSQIYSDCTSNTANAFSHWEAAAEQSLRSYEDMQPLLKEMADEAKSLAMTYQKAAVSALKRANEAAREVLPNSAETRMVFTSNLRQLRHILLMRGDEPADLQIRRIAMGMLPPAKSYAPHFFNDLETVTGTDGLPMIQTNEAKRV